MEVSPLIKFQQSYKIIIEMLETREYIVSDEYKQHSTDLSYLNNAMKMREPPSIVAEKPKHHSSTNGIHKDNLIKTNDNTDDKKLEENLHEVNEHMVTRKINKNDAAKEGLLVVYFFFKKMGIQPIKEVIAEMVISGYKHAIFVHLIDLTPFSKAFISFACSKEYLEVECFLQDKLQFNIIKHHLQPTFRHIPAKKTGDIFKAFEIKKTECKKMKKTDPVAIFFNAKAGDIFWIKNGIRIDYRLVVT
jgi:DNA-directed RNA polymerase subunit H (RpoH/RPB5)